MRRKRISKWAAAIGAMMAMSLVSEPAQATFTSPTLDSAPKYDAYDPPHECADVVVEDGTWWNTSNIYNECSVAHNFELHVRSEGDKCVIIEPYDVYQYGHPWAVVDNVSLCGDGV